MLRTIIVNSSNGIPSQQIETTAQTWAELKREFENNNISYNGMKCIIGENKQELSNDGAILPEGIMNVFLLPRKTKSGITKKDNTSDMTTKKASAKKVAPAKKAAPVKKVATKKVVAHAIVSHGLKEDDKKKEVITDAPVILTQDKINEVIAETKKSMKDIDRVSEAINLLKSVTDSKARTMIDSLLERLDDISYIVATGKPRIDNLKSKKTACELANSGAYDTRPC